MGLFTLIQRHFGGRWGYAELASSNPNALILGDVSKAYIAVYKGKIYAFTKGAYSERKAFAHISAILAGDPELLDAAHLEARSDLIPLTPKGFEALQRKQGKAILKLCLQPEQLARINKEAKASYQKETQMNAQKENLQPLVSYDEVVAQGNTHFYVGCTGASYILSYKGEVYAFGRDEAPSRDFASALFGMFCDEEIMALPDVIQNKAELKPLDPNFFPIMLVLEGPVLPFLAIPVGDIAGIVEEHAKRQAEEAAQVTKH